MMPSLKIVRRFVLGPLVALPLLAWIAPARAHAGIILEAGPYLAQPAGLNTESIFRTSFGLLAGAGLDITDDFSGQLAFRFYNPSTQRSIEASLWDASATLRWWLPSLLVLSPYAEAGYFFRHETTTVPNFPSVTSSLHGPVLGAGINWSILPGVSVGPHLEYLSSVGDFLERGWLNASLKLTLRI